MSCSDEERGPCITPAVGDTSVVVLAVADGYRYMDPEVAAGPWITQVRRARDEGR